MNEKQKELKAKHAFDVYEEYAKTGDDELAQVYLKEDVDAVIAELKQKLQDQCISCPVKMQEDDVVAELKQNLEDAKATHYAESVDAGMENRRLKRALWLARSYRGRDNSILLPSKFMRNVWDEVERKCLKKAEEYK